jgi:subtilase family serine protease
MWAAFVSLVNQGLGDYGPIGFVNPMLYQLAQSGSYTSDFHDITMGNNGYYPAEPGFDDATGLGSFNGLNLYNDLVGVTLALTHGAFVRTLPNFGGAGTAVQILGKDLTGATSILFNGQSAAFTVESPPRYRPRCQPARRRITLPSHHPAESFSAMSPSWYR